MPLGTQLFAPGARGTAQPIAVPLRETAGGRADDFTRITVCRFLSSAGPNVTADGSNAGARHALPGRGACSARNTRRCGLLLQCDLGGQIARDLHARRDLAHRRFGPAFLHSFLLSYRPGRGDPLLFSPLRGTVVQWLVHQSLNGQMKEYVLKPENFVPNMLWSPGGTSRLLLPA